MKLVLELNLIFVHSWSLVNQLIGKEDEVTIIKEEEEFLSFATKILVHRKLEGKN